MTSRTRFVVVVVVFFFVASVASCAEPPRIDVPPPTMAIAPPIATTNASARTTIASGIATAERPAVVACKFTSSKRSLPTWRLALRRGGRSPFADIADGTTVIEVGASSSSAASPQPDIFVSADLGAIVIESLTSDELGLYPTRASQVVPTALAITPRARTTVVKAEASGLITTTLDLSYKVKLANGLSSKLTMTRPCGDFALDEGSFDASSAFAAAPAPAAAAAAIPMRKLASATRHAFLFDAPAGALIAELASDKINSVTIIREKDGFAHVLWDADDVLANGWVKSSELTPRPIEVVIGGTGGLRPAIVDEKPQASIGRMLCPKDVPLIVNQNGERMIAGRIKAGSVMTIVRPHANGFIEVFVQGTSDVVRLFDSASFVVREEDVATCVRN